MKHMRITTAHQSITFSRRMMLLGGAQAAVGGLLIGRMGWLAIAQNEKYNLLSESNRVQLIPVPPRRGWIIDRNGKPIAINRSSFRVDIIPQQLVDGPKVVAEVAKLLDLPADEVERINRELAVSRGIVVESYEHLVAEGFLDARPGGATRVARGATSAPASRTDLAIPSWPFDFRPGRPDVTEFPRAAWLRSLRRVLAEAPADRFTYLAGRGVPEVRIALAGYLNRVRGMAVSPKKIGSGDQSLRRGAE